MKCYDYNMNYIVIRVDKNFTPHSATRLKEIGEKLKKDCINRYPISLSWLGENNQL